MKFTLGLKKLALACSIALFSYPAFAQTTATTDPIGFVTMGITGTGADTNPVFSFKSIGLTRPVEYQGTAETVGTNTLIDNEAVWTNGQFEGSGNKCFVEITSGPRVGTTYDISNTNGSLKQITLAQDLPSGITAGVSFKIRKHWTLSSVFGPANEAGLFASTNPSLADQIQIFNGTSYQNYYYRTSAGWRKTTNPITPEGDAILYPEDGLLIRRTQSSDISVVVMGGVKTGVTSIPVLPNINIISNVCASSMTLASSGLWTNDPATGFASSTNPTLADQLLLWNGTGYTGYYYRTGAGWRLTTNPITPKDTDQIPVGSAFIIVRRSANGFDWAVPQHPATL